MTHLHGRTDANHTAGCGLMISIGTYGGFYFARGWSTRLCLGWIAFTFVPVDGDVIFKMAANWSRDINKEAKL